MSGTDPEEEEDSFGKWVFVIVSTAFFLFIALRATFGWVDEKIVLSNHQRTEGWITEYFHRSGKDDLGSGNNITYSYRVGNETFSRDVYTSVNFDECEDDRETEPGCAAIRFWVLYHPDHPEKSLVNFRFIIHPANDPVFPSTLEDFQ